MSTSKSGKPQMAKFKVTLYRTQTELLSATIEVDTDSRDHDAIVAAAAQAAAGRDDLDWDYEATTEVSDIETNQTTPSDVVEIE